MAPTLRANEGCVAFGAGGPGTLLVASTCFRGRLADKEDRYEPSPLTL